jgi:hypothetical protein
MAIDRVQLNPPLGDVVFERPNVPMRRTPSRLDGAATLSQPGRFVQPPQSGREITRQSGARGRSDIVSWVRTYA